MNSEIYIIMPDSRDYRLYLEAQFKGLHTAINTHAHDTHDRLDGIQKQAVDDRIRDKFTSLV